MASFNQLLITARHAGADVANLTLPHASSSAASIERVAKYIHGYAVSAYRGDLVWRTGAVPATATLTFAGDPTAAQAATLLGQTFTARASGAIANEFNITAGNDAANAAALAAAINASTETNVTGAVIATSALGVCTITALVAGTIGNGLRLTENLSNVALVDFAGGTNGTSTTLSAGGVS